MEILLVPGDARKIANRRPLQTSGNCTFVVDVTKLAHQDDIKKDMYGRWEHKVPILTTSNVPMDQMMMW